MKVIANLFLKLNLIKVGQPTRRIFILSKACITSLLFATSVFAVFLQTTAKAQITAATNDAGTIVNQDGNTLNIEGGTKTGTNLLHSFEKFGVNQGQTANFISNPEIQNILGRVTGGNASVINGLIQVTGGNSNLYLLNPAGIIFGSGASLNVPASFTATTANGIGLGDKWFNALGTNDYANLLGNPTGFAFTQSGAIFNAGNLAVTSGQNLTLLGGTVVNTGIISAPSGNIIIAAVPGEKLVRVTQEGSLLSLGLPVETKAAINLQPFSPLSLPQLLTGGNLSGATGVTVENGVVKLTGSGVMIPNTTGTAVVSNQVNVSGATGGTVNVLGDQVGLVGADINASGTNGGGTVLVGGDYKGQGTVANASQTFISRDSTINADALQNGNGGRVIAWADGTTRFYGNISARGGANSGDGGFVEVSGKENLAFDGFVNVGATVGNGGQLLLDPGKVTIGSFPNQNNDNLIDLFIGTDKSIGTNHGGTSQEFKINATRVTAALNNGNVSIAAAESISVHSKIDASGNSRTSNLTLTAPSVNLNDAITLNQGSNLILNSTATAANSTGGIQLYNITTDGGSITLNSTRPIKLNFSGSLTTKGGDVRFNGPVELGSSVSIGSAALDQPIVNTTGTTGTGNITFTSTIDSPTTNNVPGYLTLNAKGDVNIQDAIGSTNPVGILSITGTPFANNVSLKDFKGTQLNVEARGNVTLDATGSLVSPVNIRSYRGGNIQLTAIGDISLTDSLLLSFQGDNGELQLNAVGGNLTLENTSLEAPKDARLQAQSITVRGSDGSSRRLKAGQDLILQAQANPSTLTVKNTELQAGRNLRLTAAQGNMTLQDVTVARLSLGDTNIRLESQSLSINNSQLQADTDLNALAQTDLIVDNSKLQAYRDLTLQTQNNLNLRASQVEAGQNLQLQAQGGSGKVRVEDTQTNQAIARSGKDITITGTQAIDIAALSSPQSVLRSGGNFTFISNGSVTGNGRFISGGNFAVRNLANNPGDFRYTPLSSNGIISTVGDISFGNYNGPSLKVEAGGSITGGDIEITGANTALSGTDSDIAILSANPSLILRAGLSELRQTPNVLPSEIELRNPPNVSSGFTASGAPSVNRSIRVGKINIATSDNGADAVIMSAPSGITTGAISTNGGSVKLTSSGDKIIVDTINTRRNNDGGGSVDISSQGVFQATGSFDFNYQDSSLGFVTSPTSILAATGGIGLDGKTLEGSIRILQGGDTFVENYAPGILPDNAGGTAGIILRADGNNASLVSSYRNRIFIDSLGNNNPGGGGSNNGDSGNNNTLSGNEQQTAQRQVISQTSSSACNPSTTVAVTPQPTGSRTGNTSNTTASNFTATSNNCTPANNDLQILKILDETPDSGQNKELYFDGSYLKFGELAQQMTFKN